MFIPLFLINGQFIGIHANNTKLFLVTELKFSMSYNVLHLLRIKMETTQSGEDVWCCSNRPEWLIKKKKLCASLWHW